MCVRRGAAAAAGDVQEAACANSLDQPLPVMSGVSSKPVSLIGLGRPALG
jgi:hypothetical protein